MHILWASTAQSAPGRLPAAACPSGYTHEGVIHLIAALCELTQQEAQRGNKEAAAWLADVASKLPTGWRIVENATPRPRPRRRRAA